MFSGESEGVLERYQVSMFQIRRTLFFTFALLVACVSLKAGAFAQEEDGLLAPAFLEPELLAEDLFGEGAPRYLEPPKQSLVERFPIETPNNHSVWLRTVFDLRRLL